jgi:NhaP-type Na+/H+ or K+/H+ antiporter
MAPIAAASVGDSLIMNIVFMVIFFSVLLSTLTTNLVSSGRAVKIKERMDRLRGRATGKVDKSTVDPDSEESESPSTEVEDYL